jgi:hypothetical protein
MIFSFIIFFTHHSNSENLTLFFLEFSRFLLLLSLVLSLDSVLIYDKDKKRVLHRHFYSVAISNETG